MTCAICYDSDRPCDLTLPGCGHTFHTACVLSMSQYDVRCPICRTVPPGVQERAAHDEGETAIVYVASLEEAWEDDREEREAWTRYRTRRRRCMNQNPHILDAFNRLRDVRRDIQTERTSAESRYKALCRDLWRHDAVIRGHMRTVSRLRRRERRLERRVYDELHGRIGSEPR